MRIDVWSDVVCPFCWLGKARLDKALASFAHRDEVEVVFHSFELDPRMPSDLDIPTNQMLGKKLGVGPAQLEAMHGRLRAQGQAEGIDFRFERARTSNTFDAHQLLHFAREKGKQREVADRLFRAQFHEGVRVGDRGELVRLASEAGLDGAEARAAIDEGRYAQAVRADEEQARSLKISGVPFFVIDGRLGVSGAQPLEVFAQALDKAWQSQPVPQGSSNAGSCGEGGCSV